MNSVVGIVYDSVFCVDNAVISGIPNIRGVSSVENYPNCAATLHKFNNSAGSHPLNPCRLRIEKRASHYHRPSTGNEI